MSHYHRFNAVADKLTACKRIFHTDMSHSYSVANTDGRNENGSTACHSYARFYRVRYLVKMDMSRNYFAVCTENADKGLLKLLCRVSHCVEKTSVRGALRAFCYVIASFLHL